MVVDGTMMEVFVWVEELGMKGFLSKMKKKESGLDESEGCGSIGSCSGGRAAAGKRKAVYTDGLGVAR